MKKRFWLVAASLVVIAVSASSPAHAARTTRGHVCYPYICDDNEGCELPECTCHFVGLEGQCGA
jgi:hypothetical protein